MQGINYTPVDHLVKKNQAQIISAGQSKEMIGHINRSIPEKTDKQNNQEQLKRVEIHEFVEHEPSPQVSKYIKPRPDTIKVEKSLQKMGVAQSGQATFAVSEKITLPISDEKVLKGLHAPIRSSFRWLAQLCVYILEQAHITLKNIGGKPVRTRKIN